MKSAGVNRSLRLVVVDSDPRARTYVRTAFGERDIRVVGEADDVKNGMRFIRGLQPDVVLLELPDNASETMDAVRRIKDEFPETGVILSRANPSPQLILSGMRAGAQEFVGRPIDGPELEKAIGHVRRQMARAGAAGTPRGRVVSVFSAKGGVGGTSVCVNLAVALAQRNDGRTALVDLNFQMGDLGLMLNQPPRYSLTECFVDARVDESRLRSVLSEHESGVAVLTVATSPEIGEEITRDHIVDLFASLSTLFDHIVVDVGRQLDDRTVEVLELSDEILLLSTLDLPAVRNASRYLAMFDRLDLDRDRVRLVLNRCHKKAHLGVKDIEAALGTTVFWALPNDYEPVATGIDHGEPAVLRSRRTRIARSLRELAAAIAEPQEVDAEPQPEKAPKPAPPATPGADIRPGEVERKEMKSVETPVEREHRTEREIRGPANVTRRNAVTGSNVSVHVDLPGF